MQGNGARARTMVANASAVAAGRDRQDSVRLGGRVTRAGTLTLHDRLDAEVLVGMIMFGAKYHLA